MKRTSSRSAAVAAKAKLQEENEGEVEVEGETGVEQVKTLSPAKRQRKEESDFEEDDAQDEDIVDSDSNGSTDTEDSDLFASIDSDSHANSKVNPRNKTKKSFKKGKYCPPLRHSWVKGRVCASATDMATAIRAHNCATKRSNRHFITRITGLEREKSKPITIIDESKLRTYSASYTNSSTNSFSNNGNDSSAFHSSTSTTLTLTATSPTKAQLRIPSLTDNISDALWCDCEECRSGPGQLLFVVTRREGIHTLLLQVDPRRGWQTAVITGKIIKPAFPVDCVSMSGEYLCLGSNAVDTGTAHVYIISTKPFHGEHNELPSMKAAISIPATQVTTLNLSPSGLIIGSSTGRVRLYSLPALKECFQSALPSAVPIYQTALVKDKIVVAGRMNRVLSCCLSEGGREWITEASSLGKTKSQNA